MRLRIRVLASMLCLPLLALAAPEAFGSGPGQGWHHGEPFAYDQGLLDYLRLPRANLAERGIDFYLSGMGVHQSIVKGGVDGKDQVSGSYDLQVYLDSERLGLWKGAYALLRAEGKPNNNGVNSSTGAEIPVNFDAEIPGASGNFFRMTEWWVAQEAFDGRFEALVGQWDIGRFFDQVPFSGPYQYRFLNAHMFFNSVLLLFAPINVLGGIVTVQPFDFLSIRTGIGDPNSDSNDPEFFEDGDFDLIHQWQFKAHPFGKLGLLTLGVAYRDKEQPTIAQSPGSVSKDDSDWAFYANVSQWIYQDPEEPTRGIGVFGRVGVTDGDINPIEQHYSGGVSFEGMIPYRPKDVLGIVGWHNEFSGDFSGALDDSSEGFEIYYRIQATSWLQVTPDVQYLFDPGLDKAADDTLVLGLRVLAHF